MLKAERSPEPAVLPCLNFVCASRDLHSRVYIGSVSSYDIGRIRDLTNIKVKTLESTISRLLRFFMCHEKEARNVYDVDKFQGQYDPGASRNMFIGEPDLPESL